MKRREFLKSLGDAAAWSLAAYFVTVASPTGTGSQAAEEIRRVGVLFSGLSSDRRPHRCWQALVDGLREHGWEEGVTWSSKFAMPGRIQCASWSWQRNSMRLRSMSS